METIIQLIFVIAIVKYCLKAAMSGKLWILIAYGVAMAAISFALYPIVITQPLTIITKLLGSRDVVENVALITTAESILGILVSIYLLDNYFRPKTKRSRLSKVLKVVPGVIVFFAVGYFELLFFKWRVGGDFIVTALLYSLTIFIAIVGLALLLKSIVDGESLKLEVKLILNFAIMGLGLLVSSSVAEYNISNAQSTIEWGALTPIIVGGTLLVAIGVWLHNINFNEKLKNLIKWNK